MHGVLKQLKNNRTIFTVIQQNKYSTFLKKNNIVPLVIFH